MTAADVRSYHRRIYALDPELTEEQIAVTFAMTSRVPDSFEDISKRVSEDKAAGFHERWVLGYGHASVAEHAIVHLAVENISRLACDTLEDNRLASYTEKSTRYQVMPPDYFHLPLELESEPKLARRYGETCLLLFQLYTRLIDGCLVYLAQVHPQREKERDGAYQLRLRRVATDSCRAVLPAATLTNVGVTANARVLEHAISKLMSLPLAEERHLGEELREQGRTITPTLIKYAEANPYLQGAARRQAELSQSLSGAPANSQTKVRLIEWDDRAEEKLATALLFRGSDLSYQQVLEQVQSMGPDRRLTIIDGSLAEMGPHDAPVREFELVDYTFEYLMDYGAYREFKRHRMQSYIPQSLTVVHGYHLPQLIEDAGLGAGFRDAMSQVEEAFRELAQFSQVVAQYLVTHAHFTRVLSKVNLRECYHLFKLRTAPEAHESIRAPMLEALNLAREVHPRLFEKLQLRD